MTAYISSLTTRLGLSKLGRMHIEGLSDERLATLAATGSNDHFAALVRRYSSRIYRVGYGVCGDARHAEDIAQETFIKVYQALSSYKPELPFKPWIYRIAINVARSARRKKSSRAESGPEELEVLVSRKGNVDSAAQRLDLVEAISGLPLDYRQAVILRGVEELSFAEIGEVLEIPEATARTRFHRAKQLLALKIG